MVSRRNETQCEKSVSLCVCKSGRVCVCVYVCMYECMYVCVCVFVCVCFVVGSEGNCFKKSSNNVFGDAFDLCIYIWLLPIVKVKVNPMNIS